MEVCHRNLYQGSLIEISTKQGTVVATAYHPFWVLEGHDLANRPRPRKLADTEDEGLALRGRWVNSHDLMAGDLIYSTEGRELRVLKIVQTYEEQFEVRNLTIAQNHSFAVGNDGVLVHNTGGCGDAARVGGLGYPGSMPGASSSGVNRSLPILNPHFIPNNRALRVGLMDELPMHGMADTVGNGLRSLPFTIQNGQIRRVISGSTTGRFKGKKMDFIITNEGQFLLGHGHSVLSQGKSVRFAGMLTFDKNGALSVIDNFSGHYLTPVGLSEKAKSFLDLNRVDVSKASALDLKF